MEKCMGCLGIAFGSRRRKNGPRYHVKYGNRPGKEGGIEFENLVLNDDDEQLMIYGTTHHFVSEEEKEVIAKREYDKILEQQRKIAKEINSQTFEDEERLRMEAEAPRAVSAALKVPQFSWGSLKTKNLPDISLYSIGGSSDDDDEDDFESFLESVKTRSHTFHGNKAEYCKTISPGPQDNNNTKVILLQPKKIDDSKRMDLPEFSGSYRDVDGIADEMSSDGLFTFTPQMGLNNPKVEWDKFVGGLEDEKQQEAENEGVLPV